MFSLLKMKWHVWVKRDTFYHIMLWLLLYLLQMINHREFGLILQLTIPAVNVLFYAFVAYFNIGFLFKRYISDGKLWLHFLSLVILALVITPIKTIFLFFLSPSDPG